MTFFLSVYVHRLQFKTVYRKTSTIFDQDNPVSIQGLHERNLTDKLQTVGF